jgi:ATP/maltotriose-dependent transcriptional regulator MalT
MLLTAFPGCEERGAAHGLLAAPGKCRPELNRREIDILELAAGDVPNRQIAQRLMLSENTVKWYWREIFGKFGVRRRLQAVNAARALGLI